DPARADQLQNAVGPHPLDEGFDLALAARDFDHHLFGPHIDNAGPENIDQLANLRPLRSRRPGYFEQHQIPLDVVARADVIHLHNGDDLLKLLADLLEHAVIADDDEGHPREAWYFGL